VAAADLDPLDLEDRVRLVEFPARQLVRLEDRHDLLDAVDRLERLGLQLQLVADDTDDRPGNPLAEVGHQAQRLDPLNDVLDLLGGGMGLQDDDHPRTSVGEEEEGVRNPSSLPHWPRPEAMRTGAGLERRTAPVRRAGVGRSPGPSPAAGLTRPSSSG